MDILYAIKSGFGRSLRNWKGVLIDWFITFVLVILIVFPFRAALGSSFGSSMITEKLTNFINFDVIADLGTNFKILMSVFTSGFLLVIFLGLLSNIFITGGLFSCLKGRDEKFSAAKFFSGATSGFWSYLVIMFIMSLIILITAFIVIGIPIIIAGGSGSTDGSRMKAFLRFGSIFLLILPVFLLVTDYARAWQAANEKNRCFKAIGFGFSYTFRTFLSSYPLMIILLIVQLLFGWLILRFIPGMTPVSGGGVFLVFLFSQLLFFTKILLKVWRYGSVTVLMEKHEERVHTSLINS